jgi:hypothetical protein
MVADNRAAFGGGGVANFDFMSTAGSTIVANVTDGAGGGILNGGHLTAVDLTLKDNRADDGSSLYNSGTLVLGAITASSDSDSAECTSWGIVIPLLSPSKRGTLCGSAIPGK